MLTVSYKECQLVDIGKFDWASVSSSAKYGVHHLLHKVGERTGNTSQRLCTPLAYGRCPQNKSYNYYHCSYDFRAKVEH